MDLDFILGFISDGPTKSFAFRRLQYLRGKFTMHTLLNELPEMTEMKVCTLPDMIQCFAESILSEFLIGNAIDSTFFPSL
jgi:hypothetical protein